MDYTCERGAKRNFEPWRDPTSKELQETDEQRLDRLEREEAEAAEEEERNAMEELEAKMEESKREMQIADALDEIRTRNARIERGEKGGKEEQALLQTRQEANAARIREEEELEEAARLAFTGDNVERARKEEAQEINGSHSPQTGSTNTAHTFEKVSRPRKSNGVSLVKKVASEAPKQQETVNKPALNGGLGLTAYDSDDDDD